MKTRITLIFFAIYASIASSFAVDLTGISTGTDTLRAGAHNVKGTYTIRHSDSLVIEAGANIYFDDGARLVIQGKLFGFHATFTSKPGNVKKGYWRNLHVGDANNTGHIELNNCIVSNGGKDDNGMVYLYNGNAILKNTTLESSLKSAVVITTSDTLDISACNFSESNYPIEFSGPGAITDGKNNTFTNNIHQAVLVHFLNLWNNWHLPRLLIDFEAADANPLPYVFYNYFVVKPGRTMTVDRGNILKSPDWIYVEGIMKAMGTKDSMIFVTSTVNDNIGGDTNIDGAGTTPYIGVWGGIWFKAGSSASSMVKYCDISFGGKSYHGGIVVENSKPGIEYCHFSNNYYGAEFRNVAAPNFRNNTLASSKVVPVAMSFDSNPVFEDNAFSTSDNEYDAIGLLDGTLKANSTIVQRNFTDIENVTYLMLGNLTIPEEYTLTIKPGIVIKTRAAYKIRVLGGLNADGGKESTPIVFTSSKDDFHGNPLDTNKDGSQTDPYLSNWYGIVFEHTSKLKTAKLNHVWVKYASFSGYYSGQYINGGAVTMENCSPSITNCVIQDATHGITIFQESDPVIHNNKIYNTKYTPIALSVMATPDFKNNEFINTGWTALGLIDQKVGLDGIIPVRNVAGYDNISYILLNQMTINSGSRVDVSPGVVVKMNSNTSFVVNGIFSANGAVESVFSDSITFTSINDDNYGNPGDTKSDGDAVAPAAGNWRSIIFNATAVDAENHLSYCNFLFGGSYDGTLIFTDAGNEISNSIISDSYNYALRIEGSSTPILTNNVKIKNCRVDPIAMSLKSNPSFSETSPLFKSMANGSNGIRILEGNLSDNAELITRDVGGIRNVAYIAGRITIKANTTLTIHPGVVIKFDKSYYRGITVEGALRAIGTEKEKITFTSIDDDNKGGDTNDNGNETQPTKGQWWDILFKASSLSANNKLEYCEIFYGGGPPYQSNYTNYGAVRVSNSYVHVNKCRIEHSNSSGIGSYGSANPLFTDNEINNIRYTPVNMSMFSSPSFSGNKCNNIGIYALGLAKENYSTSDTIPMRNFGGYKNIPYYIYNTCGINSGTTITILDSLIFKSNRKSMFSVSGGLIIKGTREAPVVFTHEYDDDYGNPADTNEDGLINLPSNNGGVAITFQDVANDDSCKVFGTIFRHMQYGIILNQAAPVIDSCKFEHLQYGIRLNGVSKPLVHWNEFNDLDYTPLVNSLVSYPRSTQNNKVNGSTWRGMGVISEELVQDATLEKKDFAGIINIPYFFTGNYNIGTSVTLTIDPGVVCKFNRYAKLTVKRGLMAEGGHAPKDKIIFTDYRDDFYGGDMNRDSSATIPNSYNWKGIQFNDESLDALCKLDHCIIRYVSPGSNDAAITTVAASPTITNSSITLSGNGVRATLASNPKINYCDLYDLKYFGVNNVNKAFEIDATNCWWGDSSGPFHETTNPDGLGSKVSDKVNYTPFETRGTLNPLMGDVSLNGMIQAYDASLILQYLVDTYTMDDKQKFVANVDGVNNIQPEDAAFVQQFVVGIIDVFPAEMLSAKMDDPPQFELGDPVMNDDNTFYLPVYLKNNGNVVGFKINADYDAGQMELIDVVRGIDCDNMMMATNKTFENVKIAMAGTSEISTEAELVRLHFRNLHPGETYNAKLEYNELIVNSYNVTEYAKDSHFTVEGSANGISHPVLGRFEVYPNPAYGEFYIGYTMKKETNVKFDLYNLSGQKIATLFDDVLPVGDHVIHYKESLEPGIYFVRVTSENRDKYRKITIR